MEAVKTRIQELEAELAVDARWRELRILRETEEKLAALTNGSAGTARLRIGSEGVVREKPKKRKGAAPRGKVSQHEAAQRAVADAGGPLTTAELIDRIPLYGGDIKPGLYAARNLTSVLSARSDLRSIRWRGGRAWWLKNREAPPE